MRREAVILQDQVKPSLLPPPTRVTDLRKGQANSIPQSGSVVSKFVNSFTSCMFGDIHRGVGGAQQAGHALAILRIHRDPDTG
jgi:hypothetical protein